MHHSRQSRRWTYLHGVVSLCVDDCKILRRANTTCFLRSGQRHTQKISDLRADTSVKYAWIFHFSSAIKVLGIIHGIITAIKSPTVFYTYNHVRRTYRRNMRSSLRQTQDPILRSPPWLSGGVLAGKMAQCRAREFVVVAERKALPGFSFRTEEDLWSYFVVFNLFPVRLSFAFISL